MFTVDTLRHDTPTIFEPPGPRAGTPNPHPPPLKQVVFTADTLRHDTPTVFEPPGPGRYVYRSEIYTFLKGIVEVMEPVRAHMYLPHMPNAVKLRLLRHYGSHGAVVMRVCALHVHFKFEFVEKGILDLLVKIVVKMDQGCGLRCCGGHGAGA